MKCGVSGSILLCLFYVQFVRLTNWSKSSCVNFVVLFPISLLFLMGMLFVGCCPCCCSGNVRSCLLFFLLCCVGILWRKGLLSRNYFWGCDFEKKRTKAHYAASTR